MPLGASRTNLFAYSKARIQLTEDRDVNPNRMKDDTPYHHRPMSEIERKRLCKTFIFEQLRQALRQDGVEVAQSSNELDAQSSTRDRVKMSRKRRPGSRWHRAQAEEQIIINNNTGEPHVAGLL